MRTRDPAAKREALLDAGLTLAEEVGLGRLSVDRVVSAAKVAKGSFFHHFGTRGAYLVALHRCFHDRLTEAVEAARVDLPPGRSRLLAGTHAYLDGSRQRHAVRALLVEARAEPAVLEEIARRNEQFVGLAAPDFAAMGRHSAAAAARLWVVMAAEIAVAESDAGAILPELRTALVDYLEG